MKLDNKYFIPFMLVGAAITALFILYSSFNFKEKQQNRFEKYTLEYDSLMVSSHPYLNIDDSLRLDQFLGHKTMLVFWSSWSEKSKELLKEVNSYQQMHPELVVVAALVKDATNSFDSTKTYASFRYIDGTRLFNKTRVPGIPSFVLIDENGKVIHNHVGFKNDLAQTFGTYLK